jgi:hypothetical protein
MITITHSDIKEMLANKYGGGATRRCDMDRELVIQETNHVSGSIIIWLSGSPPKGYCIAGNSTVSLYDLNGKRFKIFMGTQVVPDEQNVVCQK